MKKYLYMAVAAIAVLSSCDKNSGIIGGGNDFTMDAPVFTATIESDATTKTQLATGSTASKKKVEWLSSDKVFIHGYNGRVVSVVGDYNVSPNATDATSATLNPGSSLRYTNSEVTTTSAYAIYPASFAYVNANNVDVPSQINSATGALNFKLGTSITYFVLPSTQKYNGTDISQIAPMDGYLDTEETGKIVFRNVTALLAITVPATECSSVKEIVVSSDQQMNGTYRIVPTTGAFTPVLDGGVGDGTTSVTLDCTDKYAHGTNITSGETKTFYVSIPPQTYGSLKIDINKDGANHYVMQTTAASITVERNKIYPINFAHTDTYGHDEDEGGIDDLF